jgi:hypothetical protein
MYISSGTEDIGLAASLLSLGIFGVISALDYTIRYEQGEVLMKDLHHSFLLYNVDFFQSFHH